jgi:hypothetical protein
LSTFGQLFEDHAVPQLQRVLGDQALYTQVNGTSLGLITIVFNEFVGAIDMKTRALFTAAAADLPSPRRGDSFVLSGEAWLIIDIRADEAGTYELRCDRPLEDN